MHFSFGKNSNWLCVGCLVSEAAVLMLGLRGRIETYAYSWKSTRRRLEGAVQLTPQHCLLSKSVTVDQNTNAPKDEPPASFCPEGIRVDMHVIWKMAH